MWRLTDLDCGECGELPIVRRGTSRSCMTTVAAYVLTSMLPLLRQYRLLVGMGVYSTFMACIATQQLQCEGWSDRDLPGKFEHQELSCAVSFGGAAGNESTDYLSRDRKSESDSPVRVRLWL
jgi:hypothetical protein